MNNQRHSGHAPVPAGGRNLPQRMLRLGVAAAALAAVTVPMAGPAQAASGGGCKNTSAVRSCISFAGSPNRLIADFYMLEPPDASWCKYELTIIKNGRVAASSGLQWLTGLGRHGPIVNRTDTLPPSKGSAYTRVNIYTCSNQFHFYADSPIQYWP
ncbi:hypothetical protein [Actinomadura keratinilytica]|uniref:Secreted protein n=1 Tax=Actinomadura keratinilytica TaxID=547461 RepID=A0ABP7YFY7_9ACTN